MVLKLYSNFKKIYISYIPFNRVNLIDYAILYYFINIMNILCNLLPVYYKIESFFLLFLKKKKKTIIFKIINLYKIYKFYKIL